MKHLLHTLEGRLATLPVPIALQLPAGQQLGAPDPAVTLRFHDRMALVALATGELGNVGAAIVEGRVALEGGMRDLMAPAAGLLTRDPARGWPQRWWQRPPGWARARGPGAGCWRGRGAGTGPRAGGDGCWRGPGCGRWRRAPWRTPWRVTRARCS